MYSRHGVTAVLLQPTQCRAACCTLGALLLSSLAARDLRRLERRDVLHDVFPVQVDMRSCETHCLCSSHQTSGAPHVASTAEASALFIISCALMINRFNILMYHTSRPSDLQATIEKTGQGKQ